MGISVKHTWKVNKSEPLSEQAYHPYVHGGAKTVYLGGIKFWEIGSAPKEEQYGVGYLDFITSRNRTGQQHHALLNVHDLAAFCQKFLLAYDGGWVFVAPDGTYYAGEFDWQDKWTDSIEEATIVDVETVFNEMWPDPDGEWVPYSVAERDTNGN